MSDDHANLLMQAVPDHGPARTVMSVVATIVAVTASAGTGLFGADEPEWAASVLMGGLLLALAVFWCFRGNILGRRCFNAKLPFELDIKHAQAARNHMMKALKECEALIKTIESIASTTVRANIFRPSDEYQKYGCACILKIDRLLQENMTEQEIEIIRFLPGQGHTGKAFITGDTQFGPPTVAITREQLGYLSPDLAYIISCPLKWNSCVLGVMNIDVCCAEKTSEPDKKALAEKLEEVKDQLAELAEKKAPLVAACLAKGKLQPVWLLRGP